MSHIFHHEDFQEGYAEGYAVGAYEAQKNMVAAMFFQAGVFLEARDSAHLVLVKNMWHIRYAEFESLARKMHVHFLSLPRP